MNHRFVSARAAAGAAHCVALATNRHIGRSIVAAAAEAALVLAFASAQSVHLLLVDPLAAKLHHLSLDDTFLVRFLLFCTARCLSQ